MEVRKLTRDDREQVEYVVSQAFMGGARRPGGIDEPTAQDYEAVGVFEGSALQAQAVVIGYHVHLGPDAVLPMGGIAGVACLPASRGKGYAGVALRRSLEMMRDAGQLVSSLFPFSWDYYRRFGWDWVGVGRRYSVETSALRSSEETRAVRLATADDAGSIAEAYARFAGRYRGMVARNDKHWGELLAHTPERYAFAYVHEAEGNVDGYLLLHGTSKESTDVREFVCLAEPARRGLLGVMRRHAMQVNRFRWSAPDDDALWSTVNRWEVSTTVGPVTQARVVNVPAALAAWRPCSAQDGSALVRVADEAAPWNEGTWRVAVQDGAVSAARAGGDPDVEMDICALSQAYWGWPDLDALRSAQRVRVHNEAGYCVLRSALAGPRMWMNDSF